MTDITHVAENGKRTGPVTIRPKRSLSAGALSELHNFNMTFALRGEIGNRESSANAAPLLCTEVHANGDKTKGMLGTDLNNVEFQ